MKKLKNVLWIILKYSIVLILNTPILVYFIGNMIEVGQSEIRGKIVEHSWTEIMIDELPLKFRALVYVAMVVGVVLSYGYIKFLIKLNIESKREARQEAKQEARHTQLLETLKNNKREDKDIEKYL